MFPGACESLHFGFFFNRKNLLINQHKILCNLFPKEAIIACIILKAYHCAFFQILHTKYSHNYRKSDKWGRGVVGLPFIWELDAGELKQSNMLCLLSNH